MENGVNVNNAKIVTGLSPGYRMEKFIEANKGAGKPDVLKKIYESMIGGELRQEGVKYVFYAFAHKVFDVAVHQFRGVADRVGRD